MVVGSFNLGNNSHPYDLIRERLKAFPEKAKYIQLERTLLEDLLKEYEQLESELSGFSSG